MDEEIKVPEVVNEEVPAVKTFTQDEIDKIVADRIARERKKFADYDEVKTRLTEFEKGEQARKQAEMSELERIQAQLAEKDLSAQTLAKQLEQIQSQVQHEKIVNAFIKAAPSVNIPSDRIDAALKLADLSAVTVGENGVEGLDAVMSALVESYTFLAEVKKPQKQIGNPSNSGKEVADKTSEQLLKEAAEKAKQSNRIEDKIAYAALKAQLSK